MNKTFKIYGVILTIVLILFVLLENNKKKVIDWSENFEIDSKTPFGLYIFSQEAESIFGKELEKSSQSPYNYYEDEKPEPPHNILVLEKEIDNESINKILTQVKSGSDAMIIKSSHSPLSDTLKFDEDYFDIPIEDIPNQATNLIENNDTPFTIALTDKKLKDKKIVLDKRPEQFGISRISKNQQILGYTEINGKKIIANFIKIPFGKGHFYIHKEPHTFTNYYLLKKGGSAYAESVLSYLPNRKTVWFVDNSQASSTSSMRFILSNPALKYAWWLFLAGILLFILFNIKRKQRIIPIIEPKKNKSVEFVKSIGNLYLNEGDFRDMMTKKAQYFLNRVRMELLIDTQNLDEKFVKNLHLKTGKPINKINKAVDLIKKAQNPYSFVIQEDLIEMNTLLDEIF